MMTTAAAAARLIADAGIERVFGLPGGEVPPPHRRTAEGPCRFRPDAPRGQCRHCRGRLRQAPRPAWRGPRDARPRRGESDVADRERVSRSGAAGRDLGADPGRISGHHTHQLLPLHDVYRPVAEVRRDGHGRHGERRRAARPRGKRRAAVRRVVSHPVRARRSEADRGGGRSPIERCGRHAPSPADRARSRGAIDARAGRIAHARSSLSGWASMPPTRLGCGAGSTTGTCRLRSLRRSKASSTRPSPRFVGVVGGNGRRRH